EAILETNRAIFNEFLNSFSELQVAKQPHGTVLFPRLRNGSVDYLCQLLRDKYETSVVPGSFFEAPEHFRVFLGAAIDEFKEGLDRLGAALHEIQNRS
ncbi:MAG TPA: aminotransferase class I/II-fold pyridoxal phosphate-dependent enzyme, partial [Terriglobia bacterium]|nr:aminotransferase class I/II-fold pyridoxal phosphate-dependent enzyme [Terriglobia bacterium]